jgi:hypothetical protein
MARTRRKKRYAKYVRSSTYYSSKRAAQNGDVETDKPTRGWRGYRSPWQYKESSYESSVHDFPLSYTTFHGSGSQPSVELIMKKRRERMLKRNK